MTGKIAIKQEPSLIHDVVFAAVAALNKQGATQDVRASLQSCVKSNTKLGFQNRQQLVDDLKWTDDQFYTFGISELNALNVDISIKDVYTVLNSAIYKATIGVNHICRQSVHRGIIRVVAKQVNTSDSYLNQVLCLLTRGGDTTLKLICKNVLGCTYEDVQKVGAAVIRRQPPQHILSLMQQIVDVDRCTIPLVFTTKYTVDDALCVAVQYMFKKHRVIHLTQALKDIGIHRSLLLSMFITPDSKERSSGSVKSYTKIAAYFDKTLLEFFVIGRDVLAKNKPYDYCILTAKKEATALEQLHIQTACVYLVEKYEKGTMSLLSEFTGIALSQISRICSGQYTPRADKSKSCIASAFGLTYTELLQLGHAVDKEKYLAKHQNSTVPLLVYRATKQEEICLQTERSFAVVSFLYIRYGTKSVNHLRDTARISTACMHQIRNGRGNVSLKTIHKLCDILHITPTIFLAFGASLLSEAGTSRGLGVCARLSADRITELNVPFRIPVIK